MDIVEVSSIKEGIITALKRDDKLTKYKLGKDLGLSTATHINNYITGKTKRARPGVMKLLVEKYGILVGDYKEELKND